MDIIEFNVWDTQLRLDTRSGVIEAFRKGCEYWYTLEFKENKNKPGKYYVCFLQNNQKKRKGFYKNRLVYYAHHQDWDILNPAPIKK